VVDGFAIYPLLDQPTTPSPTPHSPPDQTDSIFRRRDTLDPFISKFYASIQSPGEVNASKTPPPETERAGTEGKFYNNQDEGDLHVVLPPDSNILSLTSQTVVSLMPPESPLIGVVKGWAKILNPFLHEKFHVLLDTGVDELLSTKNLVSFVEFITEAFKSQESEDESPTPASADDSAEHSGAIWDWIVSNVFDHDKISQTLSSDKKVIQLFFVDLLHILISSVFHL